ncbi:septum site-determining protein Ssd [Amycolatopsis alkalitolerans]|uniref:Helicase n=1 Tax=Amycolatopsis alkalitolerans TaxID=2547244 RepID=A0A5C4LU66_9PSEU|nr:septum site-determining protein Ssd [Amycolatopsis alkalitolerans]TNC21059.1 helicase [Amycolatopsis alkalitolerans]
MTDDRLLVIVSDETLLDEILRLAAAVGCEVERAPDLVSAGRAWVRAPLVLIGEDVIDGEADLPRRRPGVLLITKGTPAPETWRRAFAAGVDQVLSLPDAESAIVGALAEAAEGPAVPGGCVVGVLGGRGGAGASVFAAGLGLAAGEDGALLVDCDPLGGGLDLLLGAESVTGVRWPGLRVDGGRISMKALRGALPEHAHRHGRFPFVSCDREGGGPTSAALVSVVDAGRRAGKVVVCDLPRHLCDGIEPVVARADLLVLVVPAEVRACVSARRLVETLGDRADRVKLVVRGPAPGGLAPQDAAETVQVPLLTSMAPEKHLVKSMENGEFTPRVRGPLLSAARIVLADLREGTLPAEVAA